ncbi:polymer-forming cytoskeletal protein [Phenylobacterium sp.]|uniref:bactofilin family protein n=1 Tax=Phenylobacterium sp. TaxID=1871053 RepID=UPI001221E937|nr:polymer-forming cytoskeletal protein [Phenylobacterium sp.]THD66903.1 MAG: polymer-forming cytoskeletal protein [Phenylobacterium sp.]
MFSKPSKPANASSRPELADTPSRKPIAMSLIAENVSVDGDIASDGDIQLDGAVHGDLKVAHLSIGETGQVEGAITADAVEIRGRVAGTITAKTVRLFASAKVDGDITHGQLAIEAGAHFAGRSVKLDEPQQEQLSLPMAAE